MSKEAQGPTPPQQPRWIDASPEALREVYARMASLGQRPDVQGLLMYLSSDPYASPVPVPGAEEGVGITHGWVSWLTNLENHAKQRLETLRLVDVVDQYLRRESSRGLEDQQDPPSGSTS